MEAKSVVEEDEIGFVLSKAGWQQLEEIGFVVVPGPVPEPDMPRLVAAYDAAMSNASPADTGVGSTTTRVNDFVNRGPEFDRLYLHPPVLAACDRILAVPYKLSTLHARTLRAGVPAQNLHVDYERDQQGWTMVGFIFMVDEFRSDNGATRFLPGSHLWPDIPSDFPADRRAECAGQMLACGPAGSMLIFNGSAWHGHTANNSAQPRRSIQGAFIRHNAPSSGNLPTRMLPETLARISPRAKRLLAV